MKKETENLQNKILTDKRVRQEVTRKSHHWFFSIFLGHYMEFDMGLFHHDMFELTEDTEHKLIVVMAFRGSGKSTIMNMSYTLWSILGVQQKKFVLIISKTQSQAKNHFLNIRDELRNNQLLAKDLGPFETDETGWSMSSLVLTKMGARITIASREQALRGIRFGQYRPDLIICDDLEDSVSMNSKEGRDDTYNWFMSEVLPAGGPRTKVIVLGNLLGADSLLLRLQKDMDEKKVAGIFRAYPLLDDSEQIMWPGKYKSKEEVEVLMQGFSDEGIWEREYLLQYSEHTNLIQLSAQVQEMNRLGMEEYQRLHPDPKPRRLGEYRISAPFTESPATREADQKAREESRKVLAPFMLRPRW